jgi:hypothetical protein
MILYGNIILPMPEIDKLTSALDNLDLILSRESLSLEIVICGAYALHLHGISRNIFTQDVDSLKKLAPQKVHQLIEQVGTSFGLGPQWLNDYASTVTLPEGIFERTTPLHRWKAIHASLVDRSDLIKMKAAAFSIRREYTIKDWEDLEALKPTKDEINSAIEFLQKSFAPPSGSSKIIKDEFKETINDLKKLVEKK